MNCDSIQDAFSRVKQCNIHMAKVFSNCESKLRKQRQTNVAYIFHIQHVGDFDMKLCDWILLPYYILISRTKIRASCNSLLIHVSAQSPAVCLHIALCMGRKSQRVVIWTIWSLLPGPPGAVWVCLLPAFGVDETSRLSRCTALWTRLLHWASLEVGNGTPIHLPL